MSVNSVNFNSMGAAPLRQNSKVSFAGQQAQEPKKSNTGKYVAAGLTLAAVAAAVVFRKDISNFVKTLPPAVKDPIMNVAKKSAALGKAALAKLGEWKNAVMSKLKPSTAAGISMPSWATTAWNAVKTAGKTVGQWVQTGWNFVKNLCVSAYKGLVGLFAKPTVPPAV